MTDYLDNQFLIAMPSLADENFHHTVTLICEHNADGALGVVINRPGNLTVAELLEHIGLTNIPHEYYNQPVYSGGPVQTERGLVIHDGATEWESTLRITPNLAVTTSRDILVAMAERRGPANTIVALGYAGWDAGQLDTEMVQNAWLSVPANIDVLFKLPHEVRWDAAAGLLGIDLRLLSSNAGHA